MNVLTSNQIICRTCLSRNDQITSLFNSTKINGESLTIADLVMACASVHVLIEDGLPSQICQRCLEQVTAFYSFKQQCENSDKMLRKQNFQFNYDTTSVENILQSTYENDLTNNQQIKPLENNRVCNQPFEAHLCSFCPKKFVSYDMLNKHINSVHISNLNNRGSSKSNEKKIYAVSNSCETVGNLETDNVFHNEIQSDNRIKNTVMDSLDILSLSSADNDCNENDTLSCELCAESYDSQETLNQHISCHELLCLPCKFCAKSFNDSTGLSRHIKLHSRSKNELENEIKTIIALENSFRKMKDSNGKQRIAKIKLQIADTDKSDAIVETKDSVPDEVESVKSTNNSVSKIKLRKCNFCHLSFKTSVGLTNHVRFEHKMKITHRCPVCDKVFHRVPNLNKHMKIHFPSRYKERAHLCPVCGQGFTQKGNLNVHLRIHTGEKPYKCKECGKMFAQWSSLRSHNRRHTGERNYKCPTCSRAFAGSYALSMHIKIHKNIRDHPCSLCSRSFRSKGQLKKHMVVHTGAKDFKCDFCGKEFGRSNNLAVHRRSHTGERPHVCSVCGKGFIQAHCLRTHVNTHHS